MAFLDIDFNPISEKGRESILEKGSRHHATSIFNTPFTQIAIDYKNLSFLLSQDFICICNKEGIIVFFNSTFTRVFGYCAEELLGKRFADLFHPADRLRGVKKIAESTKFPNTSEIRCVCKFGSFRTLRWSSQLKHDYFYIIGTDVSEQKKMEVILKKEEERHLEARIKEGSEFISHLCHEIRNPLTGIVGLTNELEQKTQELQASLSSSSTDTNSGIANQQQLLELTKKMLDSFQQMKICQEYQKSILNDNLDLTKIVEKKVTVDKSPFEMVKTVQEVLEMLKARANQKGLQVNVQFPSQDQVVNGDAHKLKQIIINLVGNAIKFTQRGSVSISLSIQPLSAHHVLSEIKVEDTGIGMGEEECKHLFERFSPSSKSISFGDAELVGSGLGLFLTKQLIELLGGNIVVESKKNSGTTFRCTLSFELPSTQQLQRIEEMGKRQLFPEQTPLQCSFHNDKTVLIVEDNKINSRLLRNILEQMHARVLTSENGLEALKMYQEHCGKIDCILMDVVMPQMDGLTATKEIRKHEMQRKGPKVPIIGVTGQALKEEEQAAYDAGMDAYITKPYNKEEIFITINKFFEPKISKNEKEKITESAAS